MKAKDCGFTDEYARADAVFMVVVKDRRFTVSQMKDRDGRDDFLSREAYKYVRFFTGLSGRIKFEGKK